MTTHDGYRAVFGSHPPLNIQGSPEMSAQLLADKIEANSANLGYLLTFAEQAMIVASLRAQGWRPIAEAPKDGTRILVTWARGDPWDAELVTWTVYGNEWADAEGNFYEGEDAPTHYMPLPAPPTERAK